MNRKFILFLTTWVSMLSLNLAQAQCGDILNEVYAKVSCTKIKTYRSINVTNKPILLITLHGDVPFEAPKYHYKFAKLVAQNSSNLISVGMLRPGYSDPYNRTSDGIKGKVNGDNYNETRVNQIAYAIMKLKYLYNSEKIILAGHSGGGAIAANLISLYPQLIDHAFIVSCPFDVTKWRKNMLSITNDPIFNEDIKTLSPIDQVKHIDNTKISIFVGKDDKITPPSLSKDYEKVANTFGLNVTLEIVEGEHNIFLNPSIINKMVEIVNNYNKNCSNNSRSYESL